MAERISQLSKQLQRLMASLPYRRAEGAAGKSPVVCMDLPNSPCYVLTHERALGIALDATKERRYITFASESSEGTTSIRKRRFG